MIETSIKDLHSFLAGICIAIPLFFTLLCLVLLALGYKSMSIKLYKKTIKERLCEH